MTESSVVHLFDRNLSPISTPRMTPYRTQNSEKESVNYMQHGKSLGTFYFFETRTYTGLHGFLTLGQYGWQIGCHPAGRELLDFVGPFLDIFVPTAGVVLTSCHGTALMN